MVELAFILFQLLSIGVAIYCIWLFLYSMLFGAPYAAIGDKRLLTMLQLAMVKKGEKVVDLGSGDGRIVVAFARNGAIAHGFEINPVLHLIAMKRLRQASVGKPSQVFYKNFWHENLSQYDIVTLYGNFPMMGRLEKKLKKELAPGARVISNHFTFPHWQPATVENDLYLYIKARS